MMDVPTSVMPKGVEHDRDELRAILVNLLEEEMGEPFELEDDSLNLREGLGLDSVDVVGLVMRVECQFRIRLAMEELMEVREVGQLLDLILAKIAARAAESSAAEAGTGTVAAA